MLLRRLVILLLVPVLLAGCSHSFFTDRFSSPGSAARDLVASSPYENLVIEIDHPPGYAPDQAALNDMKSAISAVVSKKSVTFELSASIPAASDKRYTFDEIAALEREHRDRHSGGEDAVLYVVYVAGGSSEDTGQGKVLGAVYRGTSMVIFKGNILDNAKSGLLSTRPEARFIERAVLVHEFGHAAGLVNLGAPMVTPHEDPNSRGHSTNRNSVMYYAVDNSASLFNVFTGGSDIPWQFDENDKADLRALRES